MKTDQNYPLSFEFWPVDCPRFNPPETIYPQLGANRQSQVGQAVVDHHVLTQLYPLLL